MYTIVVNLHKVWGLRRGMDIHSNEWFYNTPPWMSIEKFMLRKHASLKPYWENPVGQKPSEGKRVHHNLIRMTCCLIKNLTRKTHWDKTLVKGKRVQHVFTPPDDNVT